MIPREAPKKKTSEGGFLDAWRKNNHLPWAAAEVLKISNLATESARSVKNIQ